MNLGWEIWKDVWLEIWNGPWLGDPEGYLIGNFERKLAGGTRSIFDWK